MLKPNYVPKQLEFYFQNLDLNISSLYEIIFLGTPCNLPISYIKTWERSLVVSMGRLDNQKVSCIAQHVHHNRNGVMLLSSTKL